MGALPEWERTSEILPLHKSNENTIKKIVKINFLRTLEIN